MTNQGRFAWQSAQNNPVTTFIAGVLLLVSLIGSVLERKIGMGSTLLVFNHNAIWELELWRFFTYPLVERTFFSLLFSLIILWIFGGWFEQAYGPRDYLRFFWVSSVGAALLSIPLSYLTNLIMPFTDFGQAEGPKAALDAMLVAFALANPNSKVFFGFILPIEARTIIFVILGLDIIQSIFSGSSGLSVTLAGMLMGYLLVTGNWRPQRLWVILQLLTTHRHKGLYVVPPRDRTLH